MNAKQKIDEIMGPGGVLAQSIENYEHRRQQIKMAHHVYDALESSDRLIVEAPTGTGKTLAYLIAAALSRKRTVISTGAKNLQEQLFYKDFPFVKENIFGNLNAALLKGRGNFVCHQRLKNFLRQPSLYSLNDERQMQHVLEWYRDTNRRGEGDRAEISELPDDSQVWSEICSTAETCLGKKCPDNERCFIQKMKARASLADIMIVNHSLLASDMKVKAAGYGEVIPRYEALIVDEAHGFEDVATKHLGFQISLFRISRHCRDVKTKLGEQKHDASKLLPYVSEVEDASKRLFKYFDEIVGSRTLDSILNPGIRETVELLTSKLDITSSMVLNLPEVSEELRLLGKRASEMAMEIQTVFDLNSDYNYACWAERKDRNVTLNAAPVEIGALLAAQLYEKLDSCVFTSATLSTTGNFEYFKTRVGLDSGPEPNEVILDSPFDYSTQTLLYIPRSIPEPSSENFVEVMSENVSEILMATRGRAFVLFTSYRNMDAVFNLLKGKLPFPLMIQGSKPRTALLDEFRNTDGAVLFGTSSFWEGIDVKGESLSCVIIDRLPFAPPGDPIVFSRIERMKKGGLDAFSSYQVPMAVIALKQGLGRLIRTRTDRGALCLMDQRILTKRYGKMFIQSLHSSPISRKINDVEQFFSIGRTFSDLN